jgi:hypothetical protein
MLETYISSGTHWWFYFICWFPYLVWALGISHINQRISVTLVPFLSKERFLIFPKNLPYLFVSHVPLFHFYLFISTWHPSSRSGITKLSYFLPLFLMTTYSHFQTQTYPNREWYPGLLDCCASLDRTSQQHPQLPHPGLPEDTKSHQHGEKDLHVWCPVAPAHPSSTSPKQALGRSQRHDKPAIVGQT